LLSFLLLAIGVLFVLTRHQFAINNALGLILIGMAIFSLLIGGSFYAFVPNRIWSNIAEDGPKTMEFTDYGVRVHTRNADSTNARSGYSDNVDQGDMFLLRKGRKGPFMLIPKRAFRSSSDELRFRSLADRHIAIQTHGVRR
jgi:hypothetical protein